MYPRSRCRLVPKLDRASELVLSEPVDRRPADPSVTARADGQGSRGVGAEAEPVAETARWAISLCWVAPERRPT
jgi:hypothetical protein